MKIIFTFAFFILCFGHIIGFAQQNEKQNREPLNCNGNQMELHFMLQVLPADKLIIIIARLGKGDLKSNLNKRRLDNIYTYLTVVRKTDRDPKTIILAEGERIKEKYGQIEFYFGGELFTVLKALPNSDLYVSNCYSEEPPCSQEIDRLYYPCKGKKKISRTRKSKYC